MDRSSLLGYFYTKNVTVSPFTFKFEGILEYFKIEGLINLKKSNIDLIVISFLLMAAQRGNCPFNTC